MVTTNTWITIIAGMMVNAVLFGLGAVTVLSMPALNADAKIWLPVVIVASFVISPFLAFLVARRMRIKHWGRNAWRAGDSISG